jgi:hypothetical protein
MARCANPSTCPSSRCSPRRSPRCRRAGLAYEPKWDGFRCIVLRDGDDIELASRGTKPLTRYFPEVVEHVRPIAAAAMRGRHRDRRALRVCPAPSASIGNGSPSASIPADSRVRKLSARPPPSWSVSTSSPLATRLPPRYAVRRAPRPPGGVLAHAAGIRPDPPHPTHHRPGDRPGLVRAVRGSRAGRGRREALDAAYSRGSAPCSR